MAEANFQDSLSEIMDDKMETGDPKSKKFLEIDEDLSNEIALAVASIVAESKLYQEDDAENNNLAPAKSANQNGSPNTATSLSAKSSGEKLNKLKKKSSKGKLTSKSESAPSTAKVNKGKKKKTKGTDSTSKSDVGPKGSETGKKKSTKVNFAEDSNGNPLKSRNIPSIISNQMDRSPSDTSTIASLTNPVEKHALPHPHPPSQKDALTMEISRYLKKVQAYFDQLGYERDGEPKIHVNMRLSMKHLMGTARELIRAGHPIKCLHALVMAVHFTNTNTIIERFPLHFKSEYGGKDYKHVVLGLYVQGHFGALGISRDPGLQDKAPFFPRLSDLIHDFHRCYLESGHNLLEVKVGPIITHDPHSLEVINWKLGKIPVSSSPTVFETEIEKVSKKLRNQMGLACLRCVKGLPGASGNDPFTVPPPKSNFPNLRSRSLAPKNTANNETLTRVATSRTRPVPVFISGSNSKTKIKVFK